MLTVVFSCSLLKCAKFIVKHFPFSRTVVYRNTKKYVHNIVYENDYDNGIR